MALTAILVSAGALLSALGGGMLAIRARRMVGLVIAVGAGIRIGAAYFDLIPEAVNDLGVSLEATMLWTAVGFLAFYTIEKLTTLHVGHEAAAELDHGQVAHRHVGLIGAAGMSLHSFLDGVALAASLQVGGGLGAVIAVVVVVHRFSDGISVVSMLLASRSSPSLAYRWVAVVALAPVIGVVVGLLFPLPDALLGALLATFAGFFLYIGAAELLPEAHRADRSSWVVIGTLVGVAAIYALSVVTGVVG